MFEDLLTTQALVSLLTLTFLEIVLGIDNIIFISIISDRLPEHQQGKGRTIGLVIALVMRIALLLGISWMVSATKPLFTLFEHEVSIRDLILIIGGLFLLVKSTTEIHSKIEGEEYQSISKKGLTLATAIVQIVLLDMVFSFDSILTAVGLTDQIIIMIIAVIISMLLMLMFAKTVSEFVNRNPTVKMLALSFLLMIGMLLILDGFHVHVPKGYVYFSIAFSLFVEVLNMRMRKSKKTAVQG